ncbi:hypothetical protein F4604DRAFT_1742314 [Suillus subluteus]|nr:hypothetical protein F4604DRAFT_1742314 [Suillus subluteus]
MHDMIKSGDKLSLVKTSRQASSPHLPTEILSQILISLPLLTQWTSNTWRKMMDVLLSCCHVSKTWCEVAREILYRCIQLSQIESLRLLLRTVRSDSFGGLFPARALYFKARFSTDKEFATLAGEIVACCPNLMYLTGDHNPLCFTNIMALPKYPFLTRLKVSGQDLQLLAPLLPHLCNLESFEMEGSYGDVHVPGLYFPPPTFKLSNISISRTELSPSLCKWLFSSSSESIESLEVQEVGASSCHLVEVIGDSVKKLHVKTTSRCLPTNGSEDIKVLSGLAGVRSLRIDGWGLEPKTLLNLQSSLETLAFSNSVACNVLFLLQSGWQPSLQSLDMHYEPGSPVNSWISAMVEFRGKHELARTCAARGIQFNEIHPIYRPPSDLVPVCGFEKFLTY